MRKFLFLLLEVFVYSLFKKRKSEITKLFLEDSIALCTLSVIYLHMTRKTQK